MALSDWISKDVDFAAESSAAVANNATNDINQTVAKIARIAEATQERDENAYKQDIAPKLGISDLPPNCPLATGGPVPDFCRFERTLFKQLIVDGILPEKIRGCPFTRCCVYKNSERSNDSKSTCEKLISNRNSPPIVYDSVGGCEKCPAAAHWVYTIYADAGLICFYNAFYLGKPGKPIQCSEARENCLKNSIKTNNSELV